MRFPLNIDLFGGEVAENTIAEPASARFWLGKKLELGDPSGRLLREDLGIVYFFPVIYLKG
jgi:hypothetical protein